VKKRIAVLFHENQARYAGGRRRGPYTIYPLAKCWVEAGHEVDFVFGVGVGKFRPADLAILHVDLSVVPDEYIAFARRYPIVLNADIRDVRKSTFSRNLVSADDPYRGPVIVKSDANYAGLPERMLAAPESRGAPEIWRTLFSRPAVAAAEARQPLRFDGPADYRIYDSPLDVPPEYFRCESLVVEKFLPEREGRLYCVRNYQFLGDRETCVRIASEHPIVKSDNRSAREVVEPHPEIVAMRKTLLFDYGKFDYVVHEGKAILLDINKTPGDAPTMDAEVSARVRHRAAGLYAYFSRGTA
jgi:hypothetical protein